MLKRIIFLTVIMVWLMASSVQATILSVKKQKVYGAHFFLGHKLLPTQISYIMTDFGPGNIKFLEAIDIVVDLYHQFQGISITYTPPDGYRRQIYLYRPRGWVLEAPTPKAVFKEITIRVITPDELNK